MDDAHYRYWTDEDKADLEQAGASLPKMLEVAIRVAGRMPKGRHIVSGPITSGGMGSRTANMEVFGRAIERLIAEGKNVFSQTPFEKNMRKFHEYWAGTPKAKEYCWPIIEEFYGPLFDTGLFSTFHFLHGYESSTGARWEHDQCLKRGFAIDYLPKEFSEQLLAGDMNDSRPHA